MLEPQWKVAIDVLGPLPETELGNKYLLIAMDYFTKWPEAFQLPNQEAATVAKVLVNEFFCRFGAPLEIHSDQGQNFESNIFQEICKLLQIKKTRTTPLHPQSDGMVERLNRTIEAQLAIFVMDNQTDWDLHVPFLLMAYRSAIHDTTKCTPAELMFGRNLKLPVDLLYWRPEQEHISATEYVAQLCARSSSTC
jgi:transposase InsO family protein